MSVGVLGAGAFGTALAITLAGKGPVTLWARSARQAERMQRDRRNAARLPGADLPEGLTVTADLARAAEAETLLLAVPMQQLRGLLTGAAGTLDGRVLVACCKGVELSTGRGPLSVIAEAAPSATAALLTGPSFADDLARGLPTALTLACADDAQGKALQQALSTASMRLYRTTDRRGAELGGALKNVMAIACGAVIGAGLGNSARAALMTRGYAEMCRYAAAQGALPATLAGLSGFGDLALTCTSEQSRNFRLGMALGQGERFDPSVTVEGAATARAVVAEARTLRVEMPVSAAVVALMDGERTVPEAMANLLSRPLREE